MTLSFLLLKKDGTIFKEEYFEAEDENDDVARNFLNYLDSIQDEVFNYIEQHARMSPEVKKFGEEAKEDAQTCSICELPFTAKSVKVIDHNHTS